MNTLQKLTEARRLNDKLERRFRWWPTSIFVDDTRDEFRFRIIAIPGMLDNASPTLRHDEAVWAFIKQCAWNWILEQLGGEATPIGVRNAECGAFWANPIEMLTIHTGKAAKS